MALKIIWTTQAEKGLNTVLDYLEKEWTVTEILKLETNLVNLLNRIVEYPNGCPKSKIKTDLHKGLVDKNNYIIYRVNSRLNQIVIINFRGTKQKTL